MVSWNSIFTSTILYNTEKGCWNQKPMCYQLCKKEVEVLQDRQRNRIVKFIMMVLDGRLQHALCLSIMLFHYQSISMPFFLSSSPVQMELLVLHSPLSLTPTLWKSPSWRPEVLWKVCVVHSADRVQWVRQNFFFLLFYIYSWQHTEYIFILIDTLHKEKDDIDLIFVSLKHY